MNKEKAKQIDEIVKTVLEITDKDLAYIRVHYSKGCFYSLVIPSEKLEIFEKLIPLFSRVTDQSYNQRHKTYSLKLKIS